MPTKKTETAEEPQNVKKRRTVKKTEAAAPDAVQQTDPGISARETAAAADKSDEHTEKKASGRRPARTAGRTARKKPQETAASAAAETQPAVQENNIPTPQTPPEKDKPEKTSPKPRRTPRRKNITPAQQLLTLTEAPAIAEAEEVKADAVIEPAAEQVLTAVMEEERTADELIGASADVPQPETPAPAEAEERTSDEVLNAEFPSDTDGTAPEPEAPPAVSEETPAATQPKHQEKKQTKHQHPKLGFNQLAPQTLAELRKVAKEIGVSSITTRRKDDLINDILKTQAEALGYRYNGGTLECMTDGYGFLRPSGLLPSNNDIYVSASQIKRFGLRNGDVVWGIIRPPKEQEHYEALLRVENVNFSDPEAARHRPHFEALVPIFPTEKLNLEIDRKQIATRIVDIFAPIGKGQRALIVSPPKAGKTTLLKNLAHSITTNHPEVILMVLLIDERPEEVTDMARSVDGEIIASTFDRPAEEHLRVAALALEKAKRLVEVNKDVVLLLDSITRLARASNLIVPPSGRTLSGGMDPAALYFPKKFFGAARNIENGGSLTIIGTSLVETGSRMDDVIYEEFKGTGNMEVHLSRKISEQRIFPALDITKSGTRKEELMVPEGDLQRIWGLRRKIANMDEAEVLNLILDKLRNTPTNRDFLATIKAS